MRISFDLKRAELERIADTVQECLYFDRNSGEFDPAHEWSGADVCEALASLLDELGMVPEPKTETGKAERG